LAFPEYGFGAMDPDGQMLIDFPYMESLWVDENQFILIRSKTINEIANKLEKYAGGKVPNVAGKNVIIVDDWVATGFTVAVAANWAKRHGAKKVILAVPVCPADVNYRLQRFFDEIICLSPQQNFQAVWQFYEDFHQVEDEEFFDYLKKLEDKS
jgi:predicted phosphoribosyltransferase